MSRLDVIQEVGRVIGKDHIVELKDYDVLVLVETVKVSQFLGCCWVQNITGISVVRDFDKLRRFNVEQLYEQYLASQAKLKAEDKTEKEGKRREEGSPDRDDSTQPGDSASWRRGRETGRKSWKRKLLEWIKVITESDSNEPKLFQIDI
jgi:hypothetical protein